MLSIIKEEKNGKIKLTIETENSKDIWKWITDEEAEEIIDRVCPASAKERLKNMWGFTELAKTMLDVVKPERQPKRWEIVQVRDEDDDDREDSYYVTDILWLYICSDKDYTKEEFDQYRSCISNWRQMRQKPIEEPKEEDITETEKEHSESIKRVRDLCYSVIRPWFTLSDQTIEWCKKQVDKEEIIYVPDSIKKGRTNR